MSDYSKIYDGASKDATDATILGADFDTEFDNIETAIATKTDKVTPTVANNVATLNGVGNLADSGKQPPNGTIVGTTDSQILTNKTIDLSTTTLSGDVAVADGGTGASTAAEGFDNLKQAATDSYSGVVELATQAEVDAGTDTTRAVTPATLSAFSGSSVKALVNFDGADGTINHSYNVASVVRDSTGHYTITFTNAMSTRYYLITGSVITFDSSVQYGVRGKTFATQLTTSVEVITQASSGSSTSYGDYDKVMVVIHE